METNTRQQVEEVKKISARVVVVFIIFIITLLLFGFITKQIVQEQELSFDATVFQFLRGIQSEHMTAFFSAITFFGSINFLLPAYILLSLFYLSFKKNTRRSLNIAAIGLSSSALLFLAKGFFQRNRPPDPLLYHAPGFSFPSGHSFSSFTLCGIVIHVIWKAKIATAWKWICSVLIFIVAVLVATSRVYLHVHYASDVIAGFCLSVIWLTISLYTLRKLSAPRASMTRNQ